ncbi:hypothetical protein PIB30_068277 [Stylosanthes scabra]|uniref:Uncharacterized protein n=1 Tax=Stylosanthes scabra TaxID=79078 RepID=A0ABU6QMT3_9FABA|nr:hypothetical protein [Stylosanthes scabra]
MEAVLQSRVLLSLPTNPRNRFLHSSQALKHRFFTPKPRASWLQLTPVTAVPGAETSSDNNGVASDGGGRSFPQTASLSLRSPSLFSAMAVRSSIDGAIVPSAPSLHPLPPFDTSLLLCLHFCVCVWC